MRYLSYPNRWLTGCFPILPDRETAIVVPENATGSIMKSLNYFCAETGGVMQTARGTRWNHCILKRARNDQMPYCFRRRHNVAWSIPRISAAFCSDGTAASTLRMCSSSILSRLTMLPTEGGTSHPSRAPGTYSAPIHSALHRMDARSMTLRSSRRFPGHRWRLILCMASSVKPPKLRWWILP